MFGVASSVEANTLVATLMACSRAACSAARAAARSAWARLCGSPAAAATVFTAAVTASSRGEGRPVAGPVCSGALLSGAMPRALHQRRPRFIMPVASSSAVRCALRQIRRSLVRRVRPRTFSTTVATSVVSSASRTPVFTLASRRPAACAASHLVMAASAKSARTRVRMAARTQCRSPGRLRRCLASMRDSSRSTAADAAASEEPAGTSHRVWSACAASCTSTPHSAGYRSRSDGREGSHVRGSAPRWVPSSSTDASAGLPGRHPTGLVGLGSGVRIQALPRTGRREGAARGRCVRRSRQAAVRDTAPRRRLASLGGGRRGRLPRAPRHRIGDIARLRTRVRLAHCRLDGRERARSAAPSALSAVTDRQCHEHTTGYQSSSMHCASEHSTMSMTRPSSCIRVRSSMA